MTTPLLNIINNNLNPFASGVINPYNTPKFNLPETPILDLEILNSKLQNLANTLNNTNITVSNISNSATNNTSTSIISGPLDQFNVTSLIGLNFEILGKFYLTLTNISLYLTLVLLVIIGIFYFGNNNSKLVPNK